MIVRVSSVPPEGPTSDPGNPHSRSLLMETATTGGTTKVCTLSEAIDSFGRVRGRVPGTRDGGDRLGSPFSIKFEAQQDRCRTQVTFDDT
eukprot:8364215-Heterocapsa_arctica.AAC.1